MKMKIVPILFLSAFVIQEVCSQVDTILVFDEGDWASTYGYYDASWGHASSGDFLLLSGPGKDKMPLTSVAFSGVRAGLVQWRHTSGGSWDIFIASPGWQKLNAVLYDSLVFYVNSPSRIPSDFLPKIGLEDYDNDKTTLVNLANFVTEIDDDLNTWQKVAIPLSAFIPYGSFDLSIFKTVRFSSPERADTSTFILFIDRIFIVRFKNDSLIPSRPSGLISEQLHRRTFLKWNPSAETWASYNVYRADSENSSFRKINPRPVVKPEFIDYAPSGDSAYYFITAVSPWGNESIPSETIKVVIKNLDDESFLEMVEKFTFRYFWEASNNETGITSDRITPSGPTSLGSIAATGFALTAYAIGIERNWITREQAKERVLKTLRWLLYAPQGKEETRTTGFKGWFYHFLNVHSGYRYNSNVELSTVDTQLLLSGILFCREYFDRNDTIEAEIRFLADSIYKRVDFSWATTSDGGITTVWYPWMGDNPSTDTWYGYNEMMALYILALGSPTKPIANSKAWYVYTKFFPSQWTTFYGFTFLTFPPLFGHQYSHAWIDFRDITDWFMKAKGIDYFENSRRATYANRAYCIANPNRFRGYSELSWGITASDGPNGYKARGASGGPWNDDGTIAPTAPGGSVPFAPEICIPTLRFMYDSIKVGETYLWGEYGFKSAYNLTYNWISSDYLGIDLGATLLMIENYRTGLIWNYMRKNPYIISGLKKAGFTGGWLDTVTFADIRNKDVPSEFELGQNYPNPFNLSTIIGIKVPHKSRVELFVSDLLGRKVKTIYLGELQPAEYKFIFNAGELPSGVYFYTMLSLDGKFRKTKKMVILK